MLGMIGILGCVFGVVASVVVGAATIITTCVVNHKQMEAQEQAQTDQETMLNEQNAKAEKKAMAQRNAAYNQQEKTNRANLMAMGSAIMVEGFRTRKIKYKTVNAMNAMGKGGGPKPVSKYSYGSPVNSSDSSSQTQN